jgi:hypothetical protein
MMLYVVILLRRGVSSQACLLYIMANVFILAYIPLLTLLKPIKFIVMKKVLRLVQLYILAVLCISMIAIWTDSGDIWHYILAFSAFGGIVSLQIEAE